MGETKTEQKEKKTAKKIYGSQLNPDMNIMIASAKHSEIEQVRRIFEQEGCQNITVVDNNLDMVLRCEKEPADVLFIDITLPFMDCISTLSYMAEHELAKIILALGDDWERSDNILKLDCIDVFVTKPIESRKIIPGLFIALDQREKICQLEADYEQAEEELKNLKIASYGRQLVMDKFRMSDKEADYFFKKMASRHDRDVSDVYRMVYTILCNKKNTFKAI